MSDLPGGRPPSITGLLLVLLSLLACAWVFREVTGQRDSPSALAMLGRLARAPWRAAQVWWAWYWSSWVGFWLAVAEIFSALAGLPARPRQRS